MRGPATIRYDTISTQGSATYFDLCGSVLVATKHIQRHTCKTNSKQGRSKADIPQKLPALPRYSFRRRYVRLVFFNPQDRHGLVLPLTEQNGGLASSFEPRDVCFLLQQRSNFEELSQTLAGARCRVSRALFRLRCFLAIFARRETQQHDT